LFLAGQVNTQTVNDPFRNNEQVVILRPQIGNPTLAPEKANTTGIGVVVSPTFIPGFTASFDYYNISMFDRIGTPSNQEVADRCFAGNATYCAFIERNPPLPGQTLGQIFRLTVQPVNFVRSVDRGFDLEAAYRIPLSTFASAWDGDLTLRGLATRLTDSYTDDGTSTNDGVGEGGNRGWRLRGQVSISQGPVNFSIVGRYLNAGVLNADWIECQSGCPASVAPRLTIDKNKTPSAFYMNLAMQYKWRPMDDEREIELFMNVDNLWNKEPGIVYNSGTLNFIGNGWSPEAYDTLGRTYRAGLRFKM
jgi:outer membrane receptor protein involved in Fe transport